MGVSESIGGIRPGTELSAPKLYSLKSLELSPEAQKDLDALNESVEVNGANCDGQPEKWTGDDLPTDREAQAMCAGCSSRTACGIFVKNSPPAHGVWFGRVFGREETE